MKAAPVADTMPIRSVLVIDDDEFVRGVLSRQLAALGARVTTAHDGDSARRARQQGAFDIVLCDLKMPGVDGVELLRDFAQARDGAALVLMSSCDARTLAAVEQLARTRGVPLLGCVSKPLGTPTLKALLQRFENRADAAPAVPETGAGLEPVTAEELREAIAAGQIDVYMQPKMDVATGRLAGAEALARWLKPDGTIVMPDAFIGVAERAGLMDALTDLVLKQALGACGAWLAQGLRTTIAINLSAGCLDRLDLPERIAAEARRHGVDPEQVILEITEAGVMKDLTRSLDVVTRLRLRGFRLAVDDFGTGHSSLDRLRRFPFTELKLDRAFVDGAAGNPDLRSIVQSSIQLAHSLQLHTCAEGVETRDDMDVMRALGCDLVQGYLLAPPMPKAQLPGWAARQPQAAVSG